MAAFLTTRQLRVARQANHIDAVRLLLSEFRDASFYRHYRLVIDDLRANYPANTPLSDLKAEHQNAVIDVAHYYQSIVGMIAFDILDEGKVMAVAHGRLTSTWDAIESFVLAERLAHPRTERNLFSILQEFAERASEMPDESMLDLLKSPRRRKSVRSIG
ncbi:hypothetical protein WCD58_29520 [Actinomycetospora sp. OC33-EN07]|uniref:Uncharacterized protein n=1 Tax=Actinomycetospora flava TaxID=3129232 RepID=A0ABU8MEG5_9PSEU